MSSVIFLEDVLSRTDGNRDIIIGEWGRVSLIEWIYEGTVNNMSISLMRHLSHRRVQYIGVTNGKLLIGLADIRSY